MSSTHRSKITEQQWLEAVEAFELGYEHGSQIARRVGVAPSTVTREMKRRSAQKACRVHEAIAALEAELDAKAQREARRRALEDEAAMARLAAMNNVIGAMVKSLVAAERNGDLAAARPMVNQFAKSLGVKGIR